MQPSSKWTDKIKQPAQPPQRTQSFHHAQVSLAAHWIKETGILAPLVISEFMEDFKQQRRWIRMASVATALLSQAEFSYRVHQQREEAREREAERCPG